MNALVKYNSADDSLPGTLAGESKKALESMLPAERIIIEAGLLPKVKDQEPVNVVNDLVTILTTVYTIAGQKYDPVTLAVYADEFYQKLIDTYPAITLEEIRIALKKGVFDEFGEYYGLNVKSFVLFVRSYLFSEERKVAKNLFERKLLAAPVMQLTPQQMERTKKEFVNHLYADFLKGILITDYIPAYLCGFLEEKKLIVLSKEDKQQIIARAKSYYTRLTTQGRLQVEVLKTATQGIMDAEQPSSRIKSIARQFAIYDFFERCSVQGAIKVFAETD